MPTVAFTPKFSQLNALIPMPNSELTPADVEAFLKDNGMEAEYIGKTSDKALCIKVKGLENTVIVAPSMVMVALPDTNDFMALSGQLLELFYQANNPGTAASPEVITQ